MRENLFHNLPPNLPEELIETLIQTPNITIERIVSHGHSSPADEWYDQTQHEWVLLLQGSAELLFADNNETIRLSPGDYLHIDAHRKHRVQSTTPEKPTIWLAIFYNPLS